MSNESGKRPQGTQKRSEILALNMEDISTQDIVSQISKISNALKLIGNEDQKLVASIKRLEDSKLTWKPTRTRSEPNYGVLLATKHQKRQELQGQRAILQKKLEELHERKKKSAKSKGGNEDGLSKEDESDSSDLTSIEDEMSLEKVTIVMDEDDATDKKGTSAGAPDTNIEGNTKLSPKEDSVKASDTDFDAVADPKEDSVKPTGVDFDAVAGVQVEASALKPTIANLSADLNTPIRKAQDNRDKGHFGLQDVRQGTNIYNAQYKFDGEDGKAVTIQKRITNKASGGEVAPRTKKRKPTKMTEAVATNEAPTKKAKNTDEGAQKKDKGKKNDHEMDPEDDPQGVGAGGNFDTDMEDGKGEKDGKGNDDAEDNGEEDYTVADLIGSRKPGEKFADFDKRRAKLDSLQGETYLRLVAPTDISKVKARKQFAHFHEHPVGGNISAKIRRLSQEVPWFVPEGGTMSRELSIRLLTSRQGNLCPYHAVKDKAIRAHDEDGKRDSQDPSLTGVPKRPTKAKSHPGDPPVGYMHCGCELDLVLLEFYYWKTGKIYSPTLGRWETWKNEQMNPRVRAFIYGDWEQKTGMRLENMWMRKVNTNVGGRGALTSNRTEVEIVEEQIKVLQARREALKQLEEEEEQSLL
ncbi:hypothetical protein C8J55DRAFT_491817 [Lentinula edodes]|uniref:Uncharacterized protein n=1 Tax=Lentinula lateritia TaxID=40482 RepID=A0A9W8ZYK9_9AGAR|nr:hypothetical protein C8J55DRAFT_491817 [Lentinula edodes]